MKNRKLLKKVLAGSRKNVGFDDFVSLVEAFGFRSARVSGSHHVFVHPDIPELINLQRVGKDAKPYQIQQFLRLVERHNLMLGDD